MHCKVLLMLSKAEWGISDHTFTKFLPLPRKPESCVTRTGSGCKYYLVFAHAYEYDLPRNYPAFYSKKNSQARKVLNLQNFRANGVIPTTLPNALFTTRCWTLLSQLPAENTELSLKHQKMTCHVMKEKPLFGTTHAHICVTRKRSVQRHEVGEL